MDVAKMHSDQLDRIKKNVRNSYEYFKPNYDRYNEFKRFVFESSLREEDITLLVETSRPQLEFNILEAYISRLMGEFSKQMPDIEVHADNQKTADPMVIRLVEDHLRHVLSDQNNHHTRYEVYKDLLSGGFSVLKVMTDYAHPMSFDQVIKIERAYDPTLCGFDQLARYSHKGDGRFCFELFPKAKDEFMEEYPDIPINELNFRRDFSGFNWSYINDSTPIIMLCHYYEKKKRKTEIVQTSDKKTMTMKKYKEMLDTWGEFAAPPVIVGKPRKTMLETICRYEMIENKVIDYVETDFVHLPLIFVDGNSVLVKTPKNGNVRQVTRPYVYHAKDAQKLKNYAGISLANEIENTIQHKFMVAKEALPKEEELLQSFKDVQKANVLVYNSVYEDNPNQPIANPIREVNKIPAPPEIVQAFTGSDSLIQNILGSYDASLGINNNQLSGVAIVEAASQSNATAMPYIVGYLQGYQRAAQIYVDLIPKYYTTPRTLPIIDKEGRKAFINLDQGMEGFYDSNALNVTITAGASFQVQKSRTIGMIREVSSMSPLFAQFIAEKGLPFILNNMEGEGIEQLRSMVDEWLKEMQQQKAMAMQKAQQELQNNPVAVKNQLAAQKLQLDQVKAQNEFQKDMAKLQQDENKIMADLKMANDSHLVQLVKASTERFVKQMDIDMKKHDMSHRHAKAIVETHHMLKGDKGHEAKSHME